MLATLLRLVTRVMDTLRQLRLRVAAHRCAALGLVCALIAPVGLALLRATQRIPEGPPSSITQIDAGQAEYLITTLEQRIKLLDALVLDFNHTTTILVTATCLGIYLIRTDRGDFELPILRVKVPLLWVRVVLPGALVFWFVQWGFQLHRIIDTRVVTMLIIRAEERAESLDSASYGGVFSKAQWLRDSSYLDEWFLAFHPALAAINEGHGVGG